MAKVHVDPLEPGSERLLETCTRLIVNAFGDPERYHPERIRGELGYADPFFYRQFFVAMEAGEVLGIGGIKAADWASGTHVLYLSAVRNDRRGEGIGRALIRARIDWVERQFRQGRILVSTARLKRYRELGFSEIRGSRQDGRYLMIRRFKPD